MLLVLDASVVAKWFKEEEGSDAALKFRDQFCAGLHEIIVPDLVLYELSNALRFNKEFSEKMIKEAIASLFDLDVVVTTPSVDLISEAVSIAVSRNTTVYDAVYVALAKRAGGIFVTADRSFHRKIKDLEGCFLLGEEFS